MTQRACAAAYEGTSVCVGAGDRWKTSGNATTTPTATMWCWCQYRRMRWIKKYIAFSVALSIVCVWLLPARDAVPSTRRAHAEKTTPSLLHYSDPLFYTTSPPGHRPCIVFKPADPLQTVTAVTWADEKGLDNVGYHNFLLSMERNQWTNVHTLVSHRANSLTLNGVWLKRVHSYQQYVARLPEAAVVLLADGMDTIMTASPLTLLADFRKLAGETGKTLWIGVETLCDAPACKQNRALRSRLDGTPGPFKYPNGGLIIGKAYALKHMLVSAVRLMETTDMDDQGAFAVYWALNTSHVGLDHGSSLFGNISPSPRQTSLQWSPSSLFSTPIETFNQANAMQVSRSSNGNRPSAFHFPGLKYDPSTTEVSRCQAASMSAYSKIGLSSSLLLNHGDKRRVGSLTTTPDRLPNIAKTLESITGQDMHLDAVYLNLPRWNKKQRKGYMIPEFLAAMPVIVNWVEKDYGPLTKLLPTLDAETDPETLLFTFDDDYVYPRGLVRHLVSMVETGPTAAYNLGGQMVDLDASRPLGISVRSACPDPSVERQWNIQAYGVDILEAFLGVVYKRGWFDDSIFDVTDACFSTDDIWISAHLSEKSIPRIHVANPFGAYEENGNDMISPLRDDNVFFTKKNDVCASTLMHSFVRGWTFGKQACPIAFTPLPKLPTFGKLPLDWDDTSVESPCNMAHRRKHTLITSASVVYNGEFIVKQRKPFDISSYDRVWSTNVDPASETFVNVQDDGNMVLYEGKSDLGGVAVWATKTSIAEDERCILRLNQVGSIVLVASGERVVFATPSFGDGEYVALIDVTNNLAVYKLSQIVA